MHIEKTLMKLNIYHKVLLICPPPPYIRPPKYMPPKYVTQLTSQINPLPEYRPIKFAKSTKYQVY